MADVAALSRKVLSKIVPTRAERSAQEKLARKLRRFISKQKGPHLGSVLAGSISRDTHLSGDHDLDIFVYYPASLKRESFEKHGLKLGHSVFGDSFHEEAFSEHPYVRGTIDGFDVEIVPVYKVKDPKQKLSAVDRTPFHAEYMRKHLYPQQKNQVRLLKQFLKGIQAYGADTRFQGVPGFLVELLILEYKTFSRALENISAWRDHVVIDVAEHYASDKGALAVFEHPFLLVVDPTDPKRNVAAALSYNQFARMVAAARSFLSRPSERFFFAHESKPLSIPEMRAFLKREELVGVHWPYPQGIVEDVVWGQLSRLSKRISNELNGMDFVVRRVFPFTDGNSNVFVLFDVANPILQVSKTRIGPRVVEKEHAEAFLKAHPRPLSGPRIEEGRVVIEVSREVTDVRKALPIVLSRVHALETGSMKTPLGRFAVWDEKRILSFASSHGGFAKGLSAFLKGKEFFL